MYVSVCVWVCTWDDHFYVSLLLICIVHSPSTSPPPPATTKPFPLFPYAHLPRICCFSYEIPLSYSSTLFCPVTLPPHSSHFLWESIFKSRHLPVMSNILTVISNYLLVFFSILLPEDLLNKSSVSLLCILQTTEVEHQMIKINNCIFLIRWKKTNSSHLGHIKNQVLRILYTNILK